MASGSLPIRCRCGTLRGTLIEPHPGAGTRCICYCSDCQAFLEHLGQGALLDAWGGTDLFQTTPRRVTIEAGAEQLRCLRLTAQGVLRWFTACCQTPIANTPADARLPLAAIFVSSLEAEPKERLEALLGPVRYRTQGLDARGTPPSSTHPRDALGHILRTIRLILQWRLSGHARPTPFFGSGGQPVAPVERVDTAR